MTQQEIDQALDNFKNEQRLDQLDTPEHLDAALDRMIEQETQQVSA